MRAARGTQTGTCNFEGCESRKFSKGYCNRHYQQLKKAGEFAPAVSEEVAKEVRKANELLESSIARMKEERAAKKRAEIAARLERARQRPFARCGCGEIFVHVPGEHYCCSVCTIAARREGADNGEGIHERKRSA